MQGRGFSVAVGCAFWALVPLFVFGGWRFMRGQGWGYSRLGWSLAETTCRQSMARDYLATRDVIGMSLDQLRDDLGRESRYRESWTYAVGDYVALDDSRQAVRVSYRQPRITLRFTRQGLLRSIDPKWLADGSTAAFDSETWKSTPFAGRGPMARDLIAGERLMKASREDVRKSLGQPDSAEIHIEYLVGEGMSDGVYLQATLNGDRLVTDARVDP